MRWEAQPRQAKFSLNVLDPDGPDEILTAAAGGGKTESLLIACVVWCEKYPGTWVLFLRRTYPELEAKPIPRSKELIPAGWRSTRKSSIGGRLLTAVCCSSGAWISPGTSTNTREPSFP